MQKQTDRFRVCFWGVRGSYPTSNPATLKYGGHTSCVEVQTSEHRLIFDGGTGIIPLGKGLLQNGQSPLRLYLFLSHTHHDHIIGLYFFEPLLKATTQLFIFGPDTSQKSLRATLQNAMSSDFFPIGFEEVKARKEIHSLNGGETIRLKTGRAKPTISQGLCLVPPPTNGDLVIATYKSPAHPKHGVLLYRVTYRGKSIVYATDIEQQNGGYPEVIEFARGADLLIHDAQYLNTEYSSSTDPRIGWGHTTVERAIEVAQKAQVNQLVLFHHEPTHDDATLQDIERKAQLLFPTTVAGYEGMAIELL
jgi:ribonuclease BN (tRNA processing enzyme)